MFPLVIYVQTIEESFKDLKSLLSLDKIMNKSQEYMEKMVALLLIAYTIGLLVGESIRDRTYGEPQQPDGTSPLCHNQTSPSKHRGKYWKLYSGLFVLLKQKILLSAAVLDRLVLAVLRSFACLVTGHVRSLV